MPLIAPGKKAPAFVLKDQHGRTHRLADYAGRSMILYFYPKDDTPGCTKESCDFQSNLPALTLRDTVVLGLSILDEKSKAQFADKYGLTFPLLADADHAVAEKYGVWQKKSRYGRSYMGMGLSARMRPFKAGFRPFPTEIYRVPFADAYHRMSLEDTKRGFETLFKSEVLPSDIAAVVFEPMQGEGGYNVAEPEFIALVRELCDDHGIVMIADEIQTGFGRTGKLFAMEHFGITADLTCIGKSMGGGLPMSGIVGRMDIIDSVAPGGLGGTFAGNPLGCAAANAMLDVIQEEGLLQQGSEMGKRIRDRLEAMATNPSLTCIGDVRGLGAMVAIEIVKDRESREPDGDLASRVMGLALKMGLVLVGAGPERNVIRVLAPLNTPPAILDEGMDILETALTEAASSVEAAA